MLHSILQMQVINAFRGLSNVDSLSQFAPRTTRSKADLAAPFIQDADEMTAAGQRQSLVGGQPSSKPSQPDKNETPEANPEV